MKKRRTEQMGREKKHQSGHSLPKRGISLLCAAAMVASMAVGNLNTADVSASESVLVCTQNEHVHGDGCYENRLTCGQNEHTHGDGCYDENGGLICGQSEHVHSDGCYTKTLICGQEEHTHGSGCYQTIETQPQTKAETVPETTQTEAPTEKQTEKQQAEIVTEQQTAASETANTSETKSQATESGETAGEKVESETVKESETKKAAELKLSVSSKQSYAVAGRDALEFSTKLSGGTEPYTVTYEIKLDGKTVYEQDGFAETVTYQPKSYGEHTLYMTVTDAAGQTGRAQYTVPVSVNETENSGVWQQSIQSVTLTGDYAKDIAAIAKTQLGNKENKKNFLINKEGTKQYYSRYGQWYGDTYEEWSAMFASFCAAYADIPEQYLPREKSVSNWVQKLGSRYVGADGYTPQAGDLVFFSENLHKDGTAQLQSGSPAHVGIVIDVDAQNIYTIEGNAGGEVSRQQYGLGDSHITGYMSMAKVMEMAGKLPEETDTEAAEESESETEAAFETVNITVGDKAYWVMGHEGTEHSWETLDESVIRILDGSGATVQIEAVAKGVVFLAHTYNADGATRMETFEVHVAALGEEPESENGSETETTAEPESEPESEMELQSESETETELESEAESETELQGESETETETELESEAESETELQSESETESEKTETIVINADDVLLHDQPSVDAEVVGVVNSGTKLELLDTVEAEGTSWYKVNYRGEGVSLQEAIQNQTDAADASQDAGAEAAAEDGAQAGTGDAAVTENAAAEDAQAAAAGAEAGTSEDAQTLAADAGAADGADAAGTSGTAEAPGVEAYVRSDLADVAEVPETEEAPEDTPKILTYQDNEVLITVTEVTPGAIPENTALKVVPIRMDDASTSAKYEEVEARLQEKAAAESYEIGGFLAYDITFEDSDGNEIEPDGDVKVSFDYAKAAIPEGVEYDEAPAGEEDAEGMDAEGIRCAGITILHLEENEDGQVTDVVDLEQNNQIVGMDITDNKEVQSAQFVTDSFSTYTLTWQDETVTTYDLQATGDTTTETRTLTHEKYVRDNKDGTYGLTLTVSGAVGSTANKAKLDIVLVMDTSGSMSGSNMSSAKSAVNSLVETLNEKSDTIDAQWKLVTFASSARIRTSNWTTGDSVNTTVQNLSGNGGTNYQDALVKAQTAVSTARSDASSIVIFLTDGEPTFYLRSGNKISNTGSSTRGGGSYTTRNDYNGAIMGANALSCTRFYAVGIGLGEDVYDGMSGLKLLENVANATNAAVREAKNVSTDKIVDVFNDIAGDITTLLCGDVTVTDTLSENVDLADGAPFTISVYDENGKTVASGVGSVEIEDDVELTASYDFTTKQIKLNFPEGYELKAGYTYTVTTTIEPNETAENKYKTNQGYTDRGDAGTDAPDNATSSGKAGFYSNKGATVTYTYNKEVKTEDYPMPVVQLSDKTIGEIIGGTSDPTEQEMTHEKYIKSNGDEKNTYDLTLTVSGKVGSETNKAKLDIVLVVDYSGSMGKNKKMSTTRTAIESLVAAIDPQKVDSKWSLITFNQSASNVTRGWVDQGQVNGYVDDLTNPDGGTNYQAGLVAASNILKTDSGRDGATKIVIFLTDGKPTYHLCTNHSGGKEWDWYNHPSTRDKCNHVDYVSNEGSPCCGGSSLTYTTDYKGALTGAAAISCGQFYAIGVGLDNSTVYDGKTAIQVLEDVTDKVGAESKKTENVKDINNLVATFEDIAATVTQFLCSNVTITDTLSDYVEWIEGSDLVIEVKDKEGNVVAKGENGTCKVDGVILTARYDKENRQIVLDFPADYNLNANGYVYSVTAKVTPTDKAYDEYTTTGYPHTGDKGTDAPDNTTTTSSGMPGFFSNNGAKVTYTYKGDEGSLDYNDPVVQVYKSKLILKKQDKKENPLPGAQFSLYSVTKDDDGKETFNFVKALTSATDGTVDFGALTSGEYVVKETNAPTGYSKTSEELCFKVSKGKITFTGTEELKDWSVPEKSPEKTDDTYAYEVTVTDELEVIDFTVEKEWYDENGVQLSNVNADIPVTLVATALEGGVLPDDFTIKDANATLTTENSYSHTWESLQKYYKDASGNTEANSWKEIEYTVKEDSEANGVVRIGDDLYHVEYVPVYTGDVITGYKIKNTKWTDWSIVKTEYGTTTPTPLAGAEFKLENLSTDETDVNYGVDYYGKSDENGVLQWYTDSEFQQPAGYVPAGTYTLTEIKAPTGYSKSGVVWNITVSENGTPTITQQATGESQTKVTPEEGNTYRFYNYKLYNLPSTGGRGIYWYLIGGMLLMMAASLILYKNKREEVLKG